MINLNLHGEDGTIYKFQETFEGVDLFTTDKGHKEVPVNPAGITFEHDDIKQVAAYFNSLLENNYNE